MTRKSLESPPQILATQEWDRTIEENDLVCLCADGNVPHVYEVREFYPRVLMEHELFNNPSLLAKGFKPGDELPPLLVIRRVRTAPGYEEVPVRHTIQRKVDASKVVKVTMSQILSLVQNLCAMAAHILEKRATENAPLEHT